MDHTEYQFTKHARRVIAEREITIEWIERTLKEPEAIKQDPNDKEIEQRFRRIPEFGNRVLRVAVNTAIDPHRIVSVFFDRRMKGRL